MLTRPDPTHQNPAKSGKIVTQPDQTRGSIRPVDNFETHASHCHGYFKRLFLFFWRFSESYHLTKSYKNIVGYRLGLINLPASFSWAMQYAVTQQIQ